MRYKNEIGNKYGKLLVICRYNQNSKSGNTRWVCKCDCGGESIVQGASLRNGSTKSCGCNNGGIQRSGEIIYKKLYGLTKWQSNKRKIQFTLNLEQYKALLTGKCAYCNRDPYIKKYAYHKTRYRLGKESDEQLYLNGIDQIKPSEGYIFENCVSCCKYCNRAKSDLSIEEFKILITLIYNNLNGK